MIILKIDVTILLYFNVQLYIIIKYRVHSCTRPLHKYEVCNDFKYHMIFKGHGYYKTIKPQSSGIVVNK